MDAGVAALPPPETLLLRLDGFEGPLDLLLELARAQKVDLAKISILSLVEQFLAVIEGARRVRLELAADWLVMAAWLAWLKSRLLVPSDPEDLEAGEEAAEDLAERLRALQAIRTAAAWLGKRPLVGHDVFARGAPEDHTEIDRSRLTVDLNALMRAYLTAIRRGTKTIPYRPRALTLWTVQDALQRLSSMIKGIPDWAELARFLPDHLANPTERRAALTSTLLASLEMARDGHVRLHQDHDFGPILVRRGGMPPGVQGGMPPGVQGAMPPGAQDGMSAGEQDGMPPGEQAGESPGRHGASVPGRSGGGMAGESA